MSITQEQLADPKIAQAVSRLQLHARQVVEGVISGRHKSPHHGFSVEFAQHRDYTHGDEIRYIDWKAAARSDRLYIKEFEEETNLKAYLLVDVSESMSYQGPEAQYSKRDYASLLAAALTSLLLQQRDAVGLVIFSDEMQSYLPPRGIASHYTQILEALVAAESRPKTNLGDTLHQMAEEIKRRGLLILLSDLFGDVDDILAGLRHFRYRKHEVIVMQVLDDDEIEFPFDELTRFEGLELEPGILVDPRGIREEYLRQFEEFNTKLERGCMEMEVDLVRNNTKLPAEEALRDYLATRTRRR